MTKDERAVAVTRGLWSAILIGSAILLVAFAATI